MLIYGENIATKNVKPKARCQRRNMLSERQILGYQLRCHNEWCSGAEIYGWSNKLPAMPQRCPTCGWVALVGDGIKAIYDMPEEK